MVLPGVILQNAQFLVHTPPRIRNVATLEEKHS
jgi:hypothetical protein